MQSAEHKNQKQNLHFKEYGKINNGRLHLNFRMK